MTYCRLCAESKSEIELSTTINDSKLNIKEKLVICCQWNNYQNNNHLPDGVCVSCCEKLEKCWLFNESVSLAQAKLQEIFHDAELVSIKTETNADDDEFNLCEASEDIFVESITLPEQTVDDEKIATDPESGTENSDKSKLRRHFECEMCQKSFTTAYNLTVHNCYYFNRLTKFLKNVKNVNRDFFSCRFHNRSTLEPIQMNVLIAAQNVANTSKVRRI